MKYVYRTKNTCSTQIDFDLEGDIVTNIVFTGGCPGNLNAIAKIVDGYQVSHIVELCKGNPCGFRPTSCADQLAVAVQEAYDNSTSK